MGSGRRWLSRLGRSSTRGKGGTRGQPAAEWVEGASPGAVGPRLPRWPRWAATLPLPRRAGDVRSLRRRIPAAPGRPSP